MQSIKTHNVINVKTKSGKLLQAFEGDSITREIQNKGEYDADTLNAIRDVLGVIKPRTSLDVGANIGNHALVIAEYSQRMIAFEPIDFIFDLLQTNVSQNGYDHVTTVHVGLSDVQETKDILIRENANLGSSSMEDLDGPGERLKIETVIGDQYLDSHHIQDVDFLKMDVEGHEAAALNGLTGTVKTCQPLLLLEYSHPHTVGMFIKQNLFSTLFFEYSVFSVTVTSSKKLHGRTFTGFLRRIFYKIFANRWCLSDFDQNRHYSNIFLVPKRYKAIFSRFRFLKAA